MSIAVKGVTTAPRSVKTWNNLAVQLAHLEKYDEAVDACGIALSIYPDDACSLKNRAYYYIKMKKYGKAEQDLRHLVRLGSRDPEIYNKLGAILANAGKDDEAWCLWEESLAIKSEQKEIRKALKKLEASRISE